MMALQEHAPAGPRWPSLTQHRGLLALADRGIQHAEAVVPVRLERVHAPRLGQTQRRLGEAGCPPDRRDSWARYL